VLLKCSFVVDFEFVAVYKKLRRERIGILAIICGGYFSTSKHFGGSAYNQI
jgi:hypothetical protein